MQIQISQPEFNTAIGRVGKAVASKSALPVLSNIHLETSGDESLVLTATDLHVGIRAVVPCTVERPGATTVDARILSEFVTGLGKDDVITLDQAGDLSRTVQVTAGAAKGKINTIGADDFPAVPVASGDQLEIPAETLARLIGATHAHAAKDYTRPVLAGVYLATNDDTMSAVAADGFSLSALTIPRPDGWSGKPVLIPAIGARHIETIAADHPGNVTVSVSENGAVILFDFGNVKAWSATIEGSFPDWRQIVPRTVAFRIPVDATALERAIKRARTFARDNNDVIRLAFEPGIITVSGVANERGEGETEIEVPDLTDKLPMLALNGQYVLTTIKSIGTPQIELGINGPNQAVTFRPVDGADHLVVIMPMVVGAN